MKSSTQKKYSGTPIVEGIVSGKLTPHKLALPMSYNQWLKTDRVTETQRKNLKNEAFILNKMSANSKRKLERKIDWLLALTARNARSIPEATQILQKNCGVITLTLAKRQYHSDKYIKRQMLNIFLTELRYQYPKLSYIWKAEPQKNGNIHFHLIVNRFVSYKIVRTLWNCIQADNGYIVPKGNQQVTLEHLQTATIFEQFPTDIEGIELEEADDINWPYCTLVPSTEVKGVIDKSDVRSYLLKYVSKQEFIRAIQGRIWSNSHDLSQYNTIDVQMTKQDLDTLDELERKNLVYRIKTEYAIIYVGDFYILGRTYVSLFGDVLQRALYVDREKYFSERAPHLRLPAITRKRPEAETKSFLTETFVNRGMTVVKSGQIDLL